MKSSKFIRYAMSVAHDVYFVFFWLQMVLLGKSLYIMKDLSDGLSIVQNSNLYIINVIQNYLATTKGWMEFVSLCFRDLSLGTLILLILFHAVGKRKMMTLTYMFTMIFVLLVLLILRSANYQEGLLRMHYLGLGMIVIAAIMVGFNFFMMFTTFSHKDKNTFG